MRLISHPVLCNYYVTYRCNASCDFCDIWERPSPYVTVDSVRKNLCDLQKMGVKVVDFTGGEPLLHREIDQLLTIAKSLGFITTLTTNGLLYPKWSEKLTGLVDMLHFSLDAATAEEHDASRGVQCFDNVLESLRIAKALGEKPDILFTVFSENIDQIDEVYNSIVLPNDLVLILNPAFEYNQVKTGEVLTREDLDYLHEWGRKKNVYLNEGFLTLRRNGGNQVDDPICKAASSSIVISPENELVLPCYHLGIKSFPIHGRLAEVYGSEEVQSLVAMEGKFPGCEGCTINCYMEPSFAVEMNRYWWKSLPSTIKYNRMKGTWKHLLKK